MADVNAGNTALAVLGITIMGLWVCGMLVALGFLIQNTCNKHIVPLVQKLINFVQVSASESKSTLN